MPELLPHYDRACALVGDDEVAHRILSHYRPAVAPHGCSVAIWRGQDGPALVRNYDYRLETVTGRFEFTRWGDRELIASAQRPWGGCLDGMNSDGLAAAITHGGGQAQAQGFSVILMLRYVLETCTNVRDGVASLCRIPIAQAQNVVLLDAAGNHATLFLRPDRAALVTSNPTCTNHQERGEPGSDSLGRQTFLDTVLERGSIDLEGLTGLFLAPPLYSRRSASTTAYTAVYRPVERQVDYLWPRKRWRQSFGRFTEAEYIHAFVLEA